MDFNAFAEEFADLIADKVIERMNKNTPGNWPGEVEVKTASPISVAEDTKPEENFDTVQSYDEIDTTKAERTDALGALGRHKVKELLKAAGEDLRAYGKLSDDDFFEKAAGFEILVGKELDDASEEEIEGPEVEDAEEPELTREAALELDLADLKTVAVDAGLTEGELKGLDVDAIVDLLFGAEEVSVESEADDESDEEEVELTEEQIRDASIAELKGWADDFGIEYSRTTSRNDLIEMILSD